MVILAKNNKIQQLPRLSEGILTGNRIPVDYFETSGTGRAISQFMQGHITWHYFQPGLRCAILLPIHQYFGHCKED